MGLYGSVVTLLEQNLIQKNNAPWFKLTVSSQTQNSNIVNNNCGTKLLE